MVKKPEKAPLTESVSAFTKKLGIQPTQRPSDQWTQMIEDPTRLPPKKLQAMYTAMVAWHCYSNEALANINIELLEIERKLRREKAVRYGSSSEKTKWKVDNEIVLDPTISKIERAKMKLEAKKIALETVTENYDAKSKAMSRELTRRFSEFENAGRA